ncbi:FtsH protease activity modulator HflK [Sphingomonas changnyeongensis]|uniref:Protein HflK n=2 Tax=Sphingomonas changnyeongensis TaxID=2698679 RepID=A0A7Z2NVD4_9SPHN|nr:FtsH protease activity modulator HflK [Sphingomonas changnyeongensis]QHL90070.1 FtsH protease activity modulator HflK [Sphingomonas changnyeongensis]
MLNDAGGPWGGGQGGNNNGSGGNGGGDGGPPRNPWSTPPGGRPRGPRPGGPTALDELLRRGRAGFGRGGMPDFGGRPIWLYAVLALAGAWVLFTSLHRIGPQERGVILRLGSYAGTMGPGVNISFPAPIDRVVKQDIEAIRTVDIGSPSAESENLMLTGDQNIVDLAYSVRWNISDPALFLFQLAEPEETIREVGESAMRAVIGTVNLNDAIGSGRTAIETQVAQRMQEILNDYRAGVRIQGVAIRQADPPQAVNESFKRVSASQQQAIRYLNDARAYAQQVTARAQGEAASFDKVYAEYRLAPDVTRRRMYYETMEQVLSKVDKTIVEAPGVVPYLPLPEAARRARPVEEPAQ